MGLMVAEKKWYPKGVVQISLRHQRGLGNSGNYMLDLHLHAVNGFLNTTQIGHVLFKKYFYGMAGFLSPGGYIHVAMALTCSFYNTKFPRVRGGAGMMQQRVTRQVFGHQTC